MVFIGSGGGGGCRYAISTKIQCAGLYQLGARLPELVFRTAKKKCLKSFDLLQDLFLLEWI